ncbi:hypothetical protein OCOL_001083 [Ordospora colligata]
MRIDVATKTVRQIEIPFSVSFLCGKYLTDREKNFYALDNMELRKIAKLKRNIFCLQEKDEAVYVADRFGDVYRIENGTCSYFLGIISYMTGMTIHNQNILLSDKYGRIRVSELDGKIMKYVFLHEPIESLICIDHSVISVSKCRVVLLNETYAVKDEFVFSKEQSIVKCLCKGNDELVVITNDSYHVFRISNRIDHIFSADETIVDATCVGSVLYKIQNLKVIDTDGNVVYE